MTKEDLFAKIAEYHKESDHDLIGLAYDFAETAHAGQIRTNGQDCVMHLLATAYHLAKLKMDDHTIVAGLLHEVIDEGRVSLEEVRKNFGDDVAFLVSGVSKLGTLKYRGMERYADNLRKLFVSIAQDIRIIIIKFADRLHNLETLEALPPVKKMRIAREVLEIYVPIAHRLGVETIKQQLEDYAFRYVHVDRYEVVANFVNPKIEARHGQLDEISLQIKKILEPHAIFPHRIDYRIKSLYSVYRKMLKKQSMSLEGIYDLFALRIIVETVADCYTVLGVIHQNWKPMHTRVKDYIAQPKSNNYRSLHTTVTTDDGETLEFQIQTNEMFAEAKYGVAAHWHYTESNKRSMKIEQNSDWLNEILAFQEKREEKGEYLKSIRMDAFKDRIFIFTPKGDVISLPKDATPIDYAYHIHSDIGRRCSGVKINEVMSSLDTSLKSGDVVQVLVEKNRKKPSIDWLAIAKTHHAKTKIKAQLRDEEEFLCH
ncbi:MAG: RelA/SpoT family protein [bacterium]|nr:RelA/SpoT family protein [bacterium]